MNLQEKTFIIDYCKNTIRRCDLLDLGIESDVIDDLIYDKILYQTEDEYITSQRRN